MVDDTGIEPVTPAMSMQCSPAELIVHIIRKEMILCTRENRIQTLFQE